MGVTGAASGYDGHGGAATPPHPETASTGDNPTGTTRIDTCFAMITVTTAVPGPQAVRRLGAQPTLTHLSAANGWFPDPSPKMRGPMNEPTSTAQLLKGELSRHSPVMQHYLRMTLQGA